MPSYAQPNRLLSASTALGADVLVLRAFRGHEGVCQLFQYELELLSVADTQVSFEEVLGKPVTVRMELPDGGCRYFNGICCKFAQAGRDETFDYYRAEVVPQFWFLTRKAQSRIFQQVSVPDILREVLAGLDVTYDLQGTFHTRDYCVQYRESDFSFACRLMEEEGIYYYFKHSEQGHQMVVANTPAGFAAQPGPSEVEYEPRSDVGQRVGDRIYFWEKAQELRPGKVTLWDHSFELPGKNLEAKNTIQESVQVGEASHTLAIGDFEKLELYDFPGEYAQRFDGIDPGGGGRAGDLDKIFEDNERTAGIRMQEQAASAVAISGSGHCRFLCSGHSFTLARHHNGNGSYVVTSVVHEASQAAVYRSGEDSEINYSNTFTCIPAALPYRPLRLTPKPTVHGTQTAVVVGPAGEEIFTDKYGRVKVQFHWDRQGKKDVSSSCWIRVGSFWAGKNWGAIHIPRIGQEVIVAFEEGDPDQPIIVGSVYNADQMPPYDLPQNKTQSGVKSRSTLSGTPENFNELRFEDKIGEEEVYFHAEKDFNRVVENNDTLKVGFEKKDSGDQTVEIFNNQSVTVGTPGCPSGSQTVSIYKDRTETIETGNDTLEIKMGNREATISMGNDTLTISMGNQTTKLTLGKSSTEALQSIELKVGQSSIKVDQTGVTIKGMMIKVEGTVMTEVKGLMTQVNGDAMLKMQGGITMIN